MSDRTLEASLGLSTAVYVPLFVVTLSSAAALVRLLFGPRYEGAAVAVPWLTLATVLFSATFQLRSATVGTGGRGSIAGVAACALAVNVGLNLALLPKLGIEGAALAAAAAAAVEMALTAVAAHRQGLRVRAVRVLGPAALAGCATALLIRVSPLSGLPAAGVGALLYAVLLMIAAVAVLPEDLREHVVSRPRALLRRQPT